MPQSIVNRRYWAERRKQKRSRKKPTTPQPKREIVLLATSQKEYDEMRRDHPTMKIRLDIPKIQTQLFDTRGLKDV